MAGARSGVTWVSLALLALHFALPSALAGKYATVRRYRDMNALRDPLRTGRATDVPVRPLRDLDEAVRLEYQKAMRIIVGDSRNLIDQLSQPGHKLVGSEALVAELTRINEAIKKIEDQGADAKPEDIEKLIGEREAAIETFIGKRENKQRYLADGDSLKIYLDPAEVIPPSAFAAVDTHGTSGRRPVDDNRARPMDEGEYVRQRDALLTEISGLVPGGTKWKKAALKELKRQEDARRRAGLPPESEAKLIELQQIRDTLIEFAREVNKVPTDARKKELGRYDVLLEQYAAHGASPHYYNALKRYMRNKKALRGVAKFAEVESKLMEAVRNNPDLLKSNPDFLATKLGEWLDLDINGHKKLEDPETFRKWLAASKVEDVAELKPHFKPRGLCNRIKGNDCYPGAIKCRKAA